MQFLEKTNISVQECFCYRSFTLISWYHHFLSGCIPYAYSGFNDSSKVEVLGTGGNSALQENVFRRGTVSYGR